MLERALMADDRVYIRMSEETNASPLDGDGLVVLRSGAPLVVAVGPTLEPVLEATADLDVGVAYLSTVRPFPHGAFEGVDDVVLVEPYLAGTSAGEVTTAIGHRPHRLLALGVPNGEFRHYGSGREHRAAHGLDAAGIRRRLEARESRRERAAS
jgi:transketolase